MSRQKLVLVFLAALSFLVLGCSQGLHSGTYTDPETGKVYENTLYVDPDGWSVDYVASAKEPNATWWEYYEFLKSGGDGSQVSAWAKQIWARNQANGMYRVLLYVDKTGADNYLCFALNLHGTALQWTDESHFLIKVVCDGDSSLFRSSEIIFSKDQERQFFSTAKTPVTIVDDGTWDAGKWSEGQGRILATVRFPFAGKFPDKIVTCKVENVRSVGSTASER